MKKKKEAIFSFIREKMFCKDGYEEGLDTKTVATALGIQRSNASALLNELVQDGRLQKTASRPVKYRLAQPGRKNGGRSCFEKLVGASGSLGETVRLAQAAVLYPKKRLNLFITAEAGCGTTAFVSCLFCFAKEQEILHAEGKLYTLNCRNYRTEPEEFRNQLFGREGRPEEGLLWAAKRGVLLLEHSEELSEKQRGLLAEFLDTGYLYDGDRKKAVDCHDVFFIVQSSKAEAGLWNGNMVALTLPPWRERPVQEHFWLMVRFLEEEAKSLGRTIQMTTEVGKLLVTADFSENIRGLKREIKQMCAMAFARISQEPERDIRIMREDVSQAVWDQGFGKTLLLPELEEFIGDSNLLHFDREQGLLRYEESRSMELQGYRESEGSAPVLVYLFADTGLAPVLAAITNEAVKKSFSFFYEISKGETKEEIIAALVSSLQKVEFGGGVLVISDSDISDAFLQEFANRLGAKVQMLALPIVTFCSELASQWAKGRKLEELWYTALLQRNQLFQIRERKQELIITWCYRRPGGAEEAKRYVDQYSKLGIKVLALTEPDKAELRNQVLELKRVYHIHALIGNRDPHLMDIPYISLSDLFQAGVEQIDRVLCFEPYCVPSEYYKEYYDRLSKQLSAASLTDIKMTVPKIVDQISVLYPMKEEEQRELFWYLAQLPEQIRQGRRGIVSPEKKKVLADKKQDCDLLRSLLRPMEKRFRIIIDDYEIATLVRKLTEAQQKDLD